MKAEIKQDFVFTPVELNLTIESKRELELLACLFNSSGEDLRVFVNDNRYDVNNSLIPEFDGYDITKLKSANIWKVLDDVLKKY